MNALAWFDESFSLRFVQTLLHFLWQGALIATAARVIERLFKSGPARAKYLLYLLALLAMACCLPATFVRIRPSPPARHHAAADRATPPAHAAQPMMLGDMESRLSGMHAGNAEFAVPAKDRPALLAGATESGAPPTGMLKDAAKRSGELGTATQDNRPRPAGSWLIRLAPYVTVAYLVCVSGLIVRLTIGVWGGHKLRCVTVAVSDAALLAAVARQARQIGLRAAPAVAWCERISVPVVIGVLRPMILLPATLASGLSPSQLEALIAHELAHLRRFDPMVNFLQRVVEAALFFHPAVWYVSRRIHAERENASDDLVLAAGWRRLDYADALVRMAELAAVRRGQATPSLAALAASGGNQSEFNRRVMRLLDPQPVHFRLSGAGAATLVAAVAFVVATPLAMRAWAQQKPDATAETPSAESERLGRRIENFRLHDYLGAEHSLDEFANRDVVVVVFLGVECPLSKLYGPRLQRLADQFKSQSVAIIGIDSNQQDTPSEVGHFARRHGVTFTLLKDPAARIADQFQAERTPEAFVLDRQRKVRYRGRIDDQFGVGYARQGAKQNYVASAIDELLAGRQVSVPHAAPAGCHIGRASRVAPTGDITYTNQIARIIDRRCIECHREGGIAPFTLDSYATVAAWAETIREVVEDGRMPPWHANPKYGHFANDGRMPEAEKQLLYQWVANGVPEGNAEDLPPRRQFADGWALGPPDLLLSMPEPITIPPNGVLDYQYVTVDPGFTEGKWIRASEIHPGVRSVVHHLVVFINPPGGDPVLKKRGIGFEMAGGYVPGAPPMQLPEGVARYVPAGSTFMLQIHYTPDGIERHDQSQIGLYFADPATVHHTMQTGVAANPDFEIPPQADDYRVEAAHRFSHDMELYALAPHMHYRGKSFRAEATYPNGSREVLLDVPRYDFNWQNNYKFSRPKFMPEGTLLRCVAHYDNSENNLSNPDPTVSVRWGEQTWQEMMIGYFEGVFLNQDLSLPPPRITSTAGGDYVAHFTYRPDRPAQTVHLAGTFNEWSNSAHAMTDSGGDGVYETDLPLKAGDYRYKFVIDGNYWTHDPASRILTGFMHESFFVAGESDR